MVMKNVRQCYHFMQVFQCLINLGYFSRSQAVFPGLQCIYSHKDQLVDVRSKIITLKKGQLIL